MYNSIVTNLVNLAMTMFMKLLYNYNIILDKFIMFFIGLCILKNYDTKYNQYGFSCLVYMKEIISNTRGPSNIIVLSIYKFKLPQRSTWYNYVKKLCHVVLKEYSGI
jgi:hypothetical protein